MSSDSDDSAPLRAADPEEYSQRRRLKRIHDARERVIEKRWDAVRGLHTGELTEYGAKSLIRYAVEDYIMEAERPLRSLSKPDSNDEDDRDYWDGVQLGQQTAPGLGIVDNFEGLQSILDAPDPLVYEYTTTEQTIDYRVEETTKTVTIQIDPEILMAAYRHVNDALGDYGLDIDLEENMEVMAFSEVPLKVDGDEEYVRAVVGDNANVTTPDDHEGSGAVEVETE